jgi:hypothetical protein
MSPTGTVFHTATVEHHVPGPRVEMAAIAYNLQYTQPLVSGFVNQNPPTDADSHVLGVREHELVRVNLYGPHPDNPARRICAIGIGDDEGRARLAAETAWFDFHASMLFTGKLGEGEAYRLPIRHQVPGVPARATVVGVGYDVHYIRPLVEAAVARNMPTHDEFHVVHSGDLTLMRVSLYGSHPLDSHRSVCVGGVADRHYRATAAAERAWADYHTSLLFAAHAIGSG